jgi:hypothetical protein
MVESIQSQSTCSFRLLEDDAFFRGPGDSGVEGRFDDESNLRYSERDQAIDQQW